MPVYHDPCGRFVLGDARTALAYLPDRSVECVLTDPPYGMNYKSQRVKDRPRPVARRMLGDNRHEAEKLLDEVLSVLEPKLAPTCHVYIFTHWKVLDRVLPIVARHFRVRNVLVWDKGVHGMGDLRYWAPRYELIVFATKGSRPLYGGRPADILQFPHVARTKLVHPAQKPVDLLRYLIEKSTKPGDLVCDPFAGSASTLLAARSSGRRFFGIEIDPHWYEVGIKRLREGDDPCLTSSTRASTHSTTSKTLPDIPYTAVQTFDPALSDCLPALSAAQ